MPSLNNPAGRLHYWLTQARDQATGPPRQMIALNAWCNVLGLNASDKADKGECLRFGSELIREAAAVRTAVEYLPPEFPRSALNGFDQIEQCLDNFSNLTNQHIENMMGLIGDTGWQSLVTLDEMLANFGDQGIDYAALDGYVETVTELLAEVSADDELLPPVRQFMVKMLQELLQGLRSAYVTGREGLIRTTDRWTASMFREPDLWDRVAGTRWGPRMVAAYRELMVTVAAVAAVLALLPGAAGDELRQIENNTTVIIDQSQHTTVHMDTEEEDIVDGEIVDDEEARPQVVDRVPVLEQGDATDVAPPAEQSDDPAEPDR